MEELDKFKLVNSCETKEELQKAILTIANDDGIIQGRTRNFSAKLMVQNSEKFFFDGTFPEVLTREYGIRQQAMYIKHYD